jgi:tetratricopeptide (TPR) repeat protein
MRAILRLSVASWVLGVSVTAFAAGGGGGGGSMDAAPPKPSDPNYTQARTLIEAKSYAAALPLLQQVVTKDPRNADAFNLLGFATRKSGNPQASLQYYTQALALDPKHLGAHEYIGEAYLMLDQLPQAEQHLARLDSICLFGCTEYRVLKSAIANFKAGRKPTN